MNAESKALISRAHGPAATLEMMCSRYYWYFSAGLPSGVGDRGDQLDGTSAEPPGQRRQGSRLPAGGDVRGVILDGVVQQRGNYGTE
jgi:hypothetical protein